MSSPPWPGEPALPEPDLSLPRVRRMLEGVMPPAMASVAADGMPHVNYVPLVDYVDARHLAMPFGIDNQGRANLLATGRVSLSIDDPYSGAGIVMQLQYLRTDTGGPSFERLRVKLAAISSHSGTENLIRVRGADICRVLDLRQVPGRHELPAALPRCDLAAGARVVSERMSASEDLDELLEAWMAGLAEHLRIEHALVWLLDPGGQTLTLLAARGYPQAVTGAELPLGDGLAGMAAREGVPIRIGHVGYSGIYGRAARQQIHRIGLATMLGVEIPLPGLASPRSQLALPLRSQGRVLGVLLVESQHDQFFGYDDEDALTLLCGQFAGTLHLLRAPAQADNPPAVVDGPQPLGVPVLVRYFEQDNSVYLDDEYLIKGVAGSIFWKLARDHVIRQRSEFTTRILRHAAQELRLPDGQDNLEVRLLLLQRRLAERAGVIRIDKIGRGRYRLVAGRPLKLVAGTA